MDQQEHIQDRSGFEQDMENSAAVAKSKKVELHIYSLPLGGVN